MQQLSTITNEFLQGLIEQVQNERLANSIPELINEIRQNDYESCIKQMEWEVSEEERYQVDIKLTKI